MADKQNIHVHKAVISAIASMNRPGMRKVKLCKEAEMILNDHCSWWHGDDPEFWAPILLESLFAFSSKNENFIFCAKLATGGTLGEPYGENKIIPDYLERLAKKFNKLDMSCIAFIVSTLTKSATLHMAIQFLDTLEGFSGNAPCTKQPKWAPQWYRYLLAEGNFVPRGWIRGRVRELFADAYACLANQEVLRANRAKKQSREDSVPQSTCTNVAAGRPKPQARDDEGVPQSTCTHQAAEQSHEGRLLRADAERNGYPPLDADLLSDPLRGHWDLWTKEVASGCQGRQVMAVENGLMARNPAGDIQARVPVCIDFGTSSTVVAVRENGRKRLLRVGVSDWKEAARARHFENPTAIEFVNITEFAGPWAREAWRPQVRWAALKCSHQAKDDISPVATPETLYSIIGDVKTWTRDFGNRPPLDMRDQQGSTLRLTDDACAPQESSAPLVINPLEVYAFHLGLAINNQYRDNGRIYHEYHLSFPVSFDSAARRRILSGFARGLERSLPASLGEQQHWREATPFDVREGADEPVAYAAAALGASDLEPTDTGLAFGVFDFGGGTTDFAFGLYRWATEEEQHRQGWESVLQLLDVAGDGELGGEKLLHMLAFSVIVGNAETVLCKDIPFALPSAEKSVPTGMERVFGDSLVARANTTRLVEALRPLWEQGPGAFDNENEGILRLNVQGRSNGEGLIIEFRVDKERLLALLRERILAGVSMFFVTFQQAFKRHGAQTQEMLHILLAGNACRSPLVRDCFEEHMQALAQQENFTAEHFLLHDIHLPDDHAPEGFTLKTGVALGLLDVVPGESMGVCPVPELKTPDAVFRHAFGTFRRGRLEPLLSRFSPPDIWQSLGFVREDLRLIAAHTDSPLALEGRISRGDAACVELVINWQAEDVGHEIFARPVGPDTVEIALDVSEEQPEGHGNRRFSLGKNCE